MRRSFVHAFVFVVGLCLFAPSARAGEGIHDAPRLSQPEEVGPRLPQPFALPELTHPRHDGRLDWILGETKGGRPLVVVRPAIEAHIGPWRRIYLGVTVPVAASNPASGDAAKGAVGNVEGYLRGVFPLPAWLTLGLSAGLTLPSARFARDGAVANAMATAAALEPTEWVQFTANGLSFRPAVDGRVLLGPLILQAREGVDALFDVSGAHTPQTSGRVLGHAGIQWSPKWEASIEGTHVVHFSSLVTENLRNASTIGPGIRYSYSAMDLGLALMTNVGSLAVAGVDRFYAARFSIALHVPGL